MESSDTLLTLAELGAAFAGFSALVSVLKGRRGQPAAAHDILRLRIVIATSVVVVAASLVPVALTNFNLSERAVWGVSAVVLLALDYAVILSFVRSYQPVRGEFPPDRTAVGLYGSLEIVEQLGLVAVILNVRPELNYALYVTALVLNICQAAMVFVRYIESEFSVGNENR